MMTPNEEIQLPFPKYIDWKRVDLTSNAIGKKLKPFNSTEEIIVNALTTTFCKDLAEPIWIES